MRPVKGVRNAPLFEPTPLSADDPKAELVGVRPTPVFNKVSFRFVVVVLVEMLPVGVFPSVLPVVPRAVPPNTDVDVLVNGFVCENGMTGAVIVPVLKGTVFTGKREVFAAFPFTGVPVRPVVVPTLMPVPVVALVPTVVPMPVPGVPVVVPGTVMVPEPVSIVVPVPV